MFKWYMAAQFVIQYKAAHGDTLVPPKHVTCNGYRLGSWVARARMAKRGSGFTALSSKQVAKLDSIGFVWDPSDLRWSESVRHLQEYKIQRGNVDVTQKYVCPDGFRLGQWIHNVRLTRTCMRLTATRTSELEAVDFIWDAPEHRWRQGFLQLSRFHEAHGNARVPDRYVAADGFLLGRWVSKQRQARKGQLFMKLTHGHIQQLESLDFIWEPRGPLDGKVLAVESVQGGT